MYEMRNCKMRTLSCKDLDPQGKSNLKCVKE